MNNMEGRSEQTPEGKECLRVSVSNLISRVRVRETGHSYDIALRGPRPYTLPDGREVPRFQAIGGGVKVTPALREELMQRYGAEFSVPGQPTEEADDARFLVPAATHQDAAAILDLFSAEHSEAFEDDVLREAQEELIEEAGLSEADFVGIETRFVGALSPINYAEETTHRKYPGTVPRRLFRLYEMVVPAVVFEKLKAAPTIRVLSDTDVQAIRSATAAGSPAALTAEGDAVIVENVALDLSASPVVDASLPENAERP